MKNKIILTGVFLLFSFFASAQIDYDAPINQYNANGQKEGFWREKIDEGTIFELYYINGKRSGVFKYFSGKGALISFGEYKDGKEIGTWYFFHDKGYLVAIQKDFGPNTQSILSDGEEFVLPYRCYHISYYPNGVIESEGILLWEISSQSDFTWEYGEWKYYDQTGKLIKTKVFRY